MDAVDNSSYQNHHLGHMRRLLPGSWRVASEISRYTRYNWAVMNFRAQNRVNSHVGAQLSCVLLSANPTFPAHRTLMRHASSDTRYKPCVRAGS
ncbi:unnamed protein product [Rangifer tarandus platyrhynchus]|uniref:Uncharacterized protein n=1 Tax=Rangifer tarandus platyrhynchus TaxID=3082113 RepID=A0ABN8XKK6_RANTA|nr:unnamed protein product [Rangifer tarandus platyrhynchus]